jgi:DNA-binding SARP family transcriptional activator
MVEVRLLGELEVVRDGAPLELPASRKTRALLAYLAATGRTHLRSALCDLLWDGPNDPRAALRWSLTKLRPIVGDALVADRDHVALRDVQVDVLTLRAEVIRSPAELPFEVTRRAYDSFRGEFLDGLELPDCGAFYAWCQAQRADVRAVRLALLDDLVRREPDPENRVRWARARVAADPYREAFHVDLVRLLSDVGRPNEAIDQYEQCKRLFERELGAKPSRALEAVRLALGASVSPVRRNAQPTGAAPFVGRTSELAAIDGASHVLVIGPPGIGKSRLLEHVASRRGGDVIVACAFELEMARPFGVWLDSVASLTTLAATVTDRARLLEAASQVLVERARNAPLTIVIDDLHWIDEASAELLHLIARSDARPRIICGARGGEIEDNPAALRVVRALRRDGLHTVTLGPLDGPMIAQIVGAVGRDADAARIHADSGGNPLFAIELARAGSARSQRLGDLVAERLERLPPAARDALLWASAFGKRFTADTLGVASGLGASDLIAALADLERFDFLVATGKGYDVTHDLIRRTLYQSLSEPRRRVAHAQIAHALDLASEPADVAHHAALGGDLPLAARASLLAAEQCSRLFAPIEAVAHADRGLRYAGNTLDVLPGLLRILVVTAGAQRRAELEMELMRVAGEAQRAGRADLATETLFILSMLHHEGGNFVSAAATSQRMLAASRVTDPATRARSLANAGRCLAQIERDMRQANAMLVEAEAIARDAGLQLREIEWGLGIVRMFAGEHDAAVASLTRALAAAEQELDHWGTCECLIRLAMIAIERRRADEARAACARLASVAAKLGEGSERTVANALFALATADTANIDNAIRELRVLDAKGFLAYTLSFAAELDLAGGHDERAIVRATEAVAAADAVGRSSQAAIAHAILARVCAARGELAHAAEHIEAVSAHSLSARAREALANARNLLASHESAAVQTLAPTDAS